jgi:hypothetical protein
MDIDRETFENPAQRYLMVGQIRQIFMEPPRIAIPLKPIHEFIHNPMALMSPGLIRPSERLTGSHDGPQCIR